MLGHRQASPITVATGGLRHVHVATMISVAMGRLRHVPVVAIISVATAVVTYSSPLLL
jgi:hypothetical protein